MVINDFHVSGFVFHPVKTNSPLIIDPNTILPSSGTFELFQSVPGWSEQVLQVFSVVEVNQFSPGSALNIPWQFCGGLA
jgi:hypothetical protein